MRTAPQFIAGFTKLIEPAFQLFLNLLIKSILDEILPVARQSVMKKAYINAILTDSSVSGFVQESLLRKSIADDTFLKIFQYQRKTKEKLS